MTTGTVLPLVPDRPADDATGAPRGDRELVAGRLLVASARHPMDPQVVVEWDTEPVPGKWWIPPRMSSLYGTGIWDRMTDEQRLELTKHELCSIAGIGIWFEMILMQMLLRRMYDRSAIDAHMRYALKEIEEECRHSLMFARLIHQLGAPSYGGYKLAQWLGKQFTGKAPTASIFASILVVEEILDAVQRQVMVDEDVQPVVRQVCRLHVVEEARHMQYARDEVARVFPQLTPRQQKVNRALMIGITALGVNSLVSPRVYPEVGLDEKQTWKVAGANPNWQGTKKLAAAHVVTFFESVGLITPENRTWWGRAGLV